MAAVLRFDEFLEHALYGPTGFYARGHGAGTTRDFLTSPEVGSLFGAVLARRVDAEWTRLGRPDTFTLVDAGAGPGTLIRTVLAAEPACLDALRCVLVDRADGMRALHTAHLPSDRVSSVDVVPESIDAGVVVANELLDNVPVRVFRRSPSNWEELWVGAADNRFEFTYQSVDPATAERCHELVPDALPGMVIPLHERGAAMVTGLLQTLQRGSVIVVDYARRTTEEFAVAGPASWLRTYRRHQRASGLDAALVDVGTCDITVDVAIDQLPFTDQVFTQADALARWGLGEVLAQSNSRWNARTSDFDLTALRHRSHASEAPMLLDPQGLGGFSVLEWTRP
jgi:SAM-dependent MidA family methyltransferase